MGYGGGIYLGRDLLSLLESSSSNSSPAGSGHKQQPPQVSHFNPLETRQPTVNNIIINNYNGNVLKNITNTSAETS